MKSNVPPIIEVKNITKKFGQGDNEVIALRGLSMKIYGTEFVIIFGPSGSGKSTLLNILAGLDGPTTGDITIDGENPYTMNDVDHARFHRRKIGMVFQAYNLIPTLTVRQNITMPLAFDKVSKAERIKKADEILKRFELYEMRNRLPTEISGGQQQRIGIIRSLVTNPPIIIADEPTGNLDSITSEKVMRLFKELNNTYDTTMVVVTHDPGQFMWADRVIHVLDGKIVKQTIYSRKSLIAEDEFDYPTEYAGEAKDFKDNKEIIVEEKEQLQKQKENEEKKKHPAGKFSVIWMHKDKLDGETQKILSFINNILSDEQKDSLESEEIERMISSISLRVKGQMSHNELFTYLDKPLKKGGVGLYKQTAKHLADSIDLLVSLKE